MNTIQIPATKEALTARLEGLGKLLTASNWERAAIVYAWTEKGKPGPQEITRDHTLSPYAYKDFAALKIRGVSHEGTVKRIRGDWEWALEHGGWDNPFNLATAKTLKPGDEVTLPTLPYPEHPETMGEFRAGLRWSAHDDDTVKSVRRLLEERPEVRAVIADDIVADAVLKDELLTQRVENAFVQKAGQDLDLAHRVFRAYGEHHPTPIKEKPAPSAANLGFGSGVYCAVQEETKHLPPFLEYIQARVASEYPKTQEVVQEEIEDLEQAKGLIDQYIDKIREAAGVNVDAVFNRLVGRE